ncbi:hypothetical protein acdb102_31190 [Acidothermaceae bacterium B102]|nr:hypothetical protein acdb102_31190 [Acidothermaceae bacterium B102]
MARYQFTDTAHRDYPALGLYNVGFNDVADLASAPDYRWLLVDPSTSVTIAPPSSFIQGTIPSMPSDGEANVWSSSVGGPIYRQLTSADISGGVGGSGGLTPTLVQTTNSTAAAGDLRPYDIGTASRVLTLPTAPADKSLVMTTVVGTAATNTLTVNAGGSAVFSVAGGATTYVLSQLGQSATFQYAASTGIWHVLDSSFSLASLNAANAALYAGAGTFKQTVLWTGDELFLGYDADVNGTDLVAAGTISQILVELDKPPVGGSVVFTFYRYTPTSNLESVIGTVTLGDGTVSSTTTVSQAVLSDDKVTVRVTSVGTTTYAGAGPKCRLAFGGSFATCTAPGIPSGLTAPSGTATGVNLSWTPGTNSSSTLIYRDGVPYVNAGAASAYTDLGPDGNGMAAGETHIYDIAGRRYASLSALTGSPVSAGPSVGYAYLPQSNGAMPNPPALVTVGTGGTSNIASNVWTISSGTAGNNAAADRVTAQFKTDTAQRSAWEVNCLWSAPSANSLHEIYLSSNALTPTGSFTNGLQLQWATSFYRFGFVSSTWVPGANGTGSTGSFQKILDTAYPVNQATTRASGGSLGWGTSLSTGTYYGLRIVAGLIDGTGKQTIYLYLGSSAQFLAGVNTLPLVNTITVTAAQRAAIPVGYVVNQQLGYQATGTNTESMSFQAFNVIPISAAGA